MKRFSIVLAVLLTSGAAADDVTGSETLLCSTSRIVACYEEGDCAELIAEEIGVPQFVVIDTKDGKVSTTRASGENRSTPIGKVNRADGLMFFQGVEQSRAFSFVIHEQSGHLTVAVSRDGMSVSVFGSCTDATDADL